MKLTGLHFLLSYQCTYECDHCFVWGSPFQSGTFNFKAIENVLEQAQSTGTVTSIYFEGGEPFLYNPILIQAVRRAHAMGFEVGVVSNSYWALTVEDALIWLEPLAGLLADLSISSDLYHADERISRQAHNATIAAQQLGIPTGMISIAQPEAGCQEAVNIGQLPEGESGVMYRGRAVEKLAAQAGLHSWESFHECPYEDLVEPGRLHVDPLGYLHVCQGITIGNLFKAPLEELCREYNPNSHPIVAPLLDGGPAGLNTRYHLYHAESYADACHLCYLSRLQLRERFPEFLAPDQMYGVVSS
jgi:organic radical activating enzyme